MKTGQVNAILAALGEIRDALTGGGYAPMTRAERERYDAEHRPAPAAQPVVRTLEPMSKASRAADQRAALQAVLDALDGWIEGCHENHQAMEHRNENRGEECWRSFAPSDFRNMVGDAARQLGVTLPVARRKPREDTVRQ